MTAPPTPESPTFLCVAYGKFKLGGTLPGGCQSNSPLSTQGLPTAGPLTRR